MKNLLSTILFILLVLGSFNLFASDKDCDFICWKLGNSQGINEAYDDLKIGNKSLSGCEYLLVDKRAIEGYMEEAKYCNCQGQDTISNSYNRGFSIGRDLINSCLEDPTEDPKEQSTIY